MTHITVFATFPTVTHSSHSFKNMPPFISIDLISTEQIELKCNHPGLWTEGRITVSISNNSCWKFQALTSSRPSRLTGTKILFGPSTFVEACHDLQEGEGGHCDLFNVLICLSSLSWPYYCPSPKANTWKHWPAGPQYWFIRWSPVVVKSLSQRTQDTINSVLNVYVCLRACVCVRKMCLCILSNHSGLMVLTKETKGLVLGTLSEVVLPRNWTLGRAGGLVHQEVDGGSACHWRTLNQQLLVF